MNFVAVVIAYNPDKKVYEYVSNYAQIFQKVLVIDNSDKNKRFHTENIVNPERITYQCNQNNQGISDALNDAFQWAILENADFLLTMDQDTIFPNEEIQKMIHFIEKDARKDVAIYSPNYAKLYIKNGSWISGKKAIKKSRQVYRLFCMTSGSFICVDALKQIEPLSNWFIGFVDYDLSAQMVKSGYYLKMIGSACMQQKIGYDTKYNPLVRIFHVVHHSDDRYYYMMRNSGLFIRKYKDERTLVKIVKLQRMRILFNLIFEPNKFDKLKYCAKGMRDARIGIEGNICYHA